MLITKETDYALRILRSLSEGGSFTVGELTIKEQLPREFAYKILKKLEKAGMVQIVRGAKGGCFLKCDLNEVTLYDVIQSIEMKTRISACMAPGYDCNWRREKCSECEIHEKLRIVQEAIDNELKSWTLYQMINKNNITIQSKCENPVDLLAVASS